MIKRVLDNCPAGVPVNPPTRPVGEPRPLFSADSPSVTVAPPAARGAPAANPTPGFDTAAKNPVVAAAWKQLDARHPQLDANTRRTAQRLLEDIFPVSLNKLEAFGAELVQAHADLAQTLGELSQSWAQQDVSAALAEWADTANGAAAKPVGFVGRLLGKKEKAPLRPLADLKRAVADHEVALEPVYRRLRILRKQLTERVRVIELLDTWIGSTLPPQFEQPWQHRARLVHGVTLTCKNAELLAEQMMAQAQTCHNQIAQIEQLLLPAKALANVLPSAQK